MKKKTDEGNGFAMGIAMLIGSIGMIAFCVACIVALVQCVPSERVDVKADTTRVVVYDTIPCYLPEPKDSAEVGHITARLPIANKTKESIKDSADTILSNLDNSEKDSIEVELPITQKHYEDSTFSAWVSGYNPSLDSIEVYQRKEVQTITIHTKEQKRWSIGVNGGIGVVYDGSWHCGPGINIGITYSF